MHSRLLMFFRRLGKWTKVKVMVATLLVFYIFCFTYIRLTFPMCQIYKSIPHTDDSVQIIDTNSLASNFKLNYTKVKNYVTSGVKISEFEFLLNSPVCDNSDVYLITVVPSQPSNMEERQAVRDTWGSSFNRNPKLKLIFLSGLGDNITNRILLQEQQKHSDIVQAKLEDSYKNLTLKTVAMLQWKKQFCPQAQFLLKADDDVFLQTNQLLVKLNSFRHEQRFLIGYLGLEESPIRDVSSKWHVTTEEYPFEKFPTFTHGPSYVISSDLIEDLYQTARYQSKIHLEDVHVTGLCAYVVHANHVGQCGFQVKPTFSLVWLLNPSLVTAHEYSPSEMILLWKILQHFEQWLPYTRYIGQYVGY